MCTRAMEAKAHLVQMHMTSPGHVHLVLVEDLLQGISQIFSYIDVALEVVAVY